MALGKNLKKKQLISSEKETKVTKKKVAKKKLIKQTAKAKSKPKSTPKAKSTTSKAIANFISEKEQEHKKQLRAKYKQEIESVADQQLQFVVFKVGAEEYAMDIAKVREVVTLPELSEAPDTPPHVLGLASVRGITFLAIDLALKFKKKVQTEARYFLAINSKISTVGFLMKDLPVTLKTSGKAVSSDLSMLDNTTKDVTYIKGIIQLENRLIFYLDADELIASDNAIVVPDELLN